MSDIPSAEHVARYCHPQRGILRDAATGDIKGLWPQAFMLRSERKETYLSLNHFEHHNKDVAHQFREILKIMRTKFVKPPEPIIARLNAARVVACGADHGRPLRVRRKFNKIDPSYAALEGLPHDNSDQNLLTKLAQRAWIDIYTAAQILDPGKEPPPPTNPG